MGAGAMGVRTFADLVEFRDRCRADGRTVVWTNGAFDLLHAGHVAGLREARGLGDVLLVGVNSDRSVRAAKGPLRPIMRAAERSAVLAALSVVDWVIVFDDDDPRAVLAALKPDVFCKGAEYAPASGRPVPERAVVEAYGGRVAYLSMVPGLSTTTIIDRLRAFVLNTRVGP